MEAWSAGGGPTPSATPALRPDQAGGQGNDFPAGPPLAREERSTSTNQYVIRARDPRGPHRRPQQAKIGNAVYYPLPLHLQPCFKFLGGREGDFPVAERAAREVLALPVYPELTEAMQARVVEAVARFYGE